MKPLTEITTAPALRWLRRATEGISSDEAAPRLGVLSGTFNPPTRAHLALACAALEQLRLDEVLFVIPQVPPHKDRLEATLEAREEMLLRSVENDSRFSAAVTAHGLFLEIHRALSPHYPASTRCVFLTGRDAAERILLRWPYADPERAIAEMFSRFDFAVAARAGDFEIPQDSRAAPFRSQIHAIRLPQDVQGISATELRKRLARGEDIREFAPERVVQVIHERGLYR